MYYLGDQMKGDEMGGRMSDIREKRDLLKIAEGRRPVGILRLRWDNNNNKMDPLEIRWKLLLGSSNLEYGQVAVCSGHSNEL
jgi:hypothetical protein